MSVKFLLDTQKYWWFSFAFKLQSHTATKLHVFTLLCCSILL